MGPTALFPSKLLLRVSSHESSTYPCFLDFFQSCRQHLCEVFSFTLRHEPYLSWKKSHVAGKSICFATHGSQTHPKIRSFACRWNASKCPRVLALSLLFFISKTFCNFLGVGLRIMAIRWCCVGLAKTSLGVVSGVQYTVGPL